VVLGKLHDPGSLLKHIVATVEADVTVGQHCYATVVPQTFVETQFPQWELMQP
jgi:hypothetical protein